MLSMRLLRYSAKPSQIGDFGLTEIEPNGQDTPLWTDGDLHNLRKRGTPGFFAPERKSRIRLNSLPRYFPIPIL